MLGYLCNHGIDFSIARQEARFITRLDSMIPRKKKIFGGGFLISEAGSREKTKAEKKVQEKVQEKLIIEWQISDREREIIKRLV